MTRFVRPTEMQDPWWATINAYFDDVEADAAAYESAHDYVAGGAHKFAVIVTEHGADPTGATDSGAAINAAIAASAVGQAIIFPGGVYRIEETILLKPQRSYLGFGNALLLQKDSTEVDAIVKMDPTEPTPRRELYWQGIHVDGNRTHNTNYVAGGSYAHNRGMVLEALQFSTFVDFAARNTGNDGLVFTGLSSGFDDTSSTNGFIRPYLYNNGRHGVVFDQFSDDNAIVGGDLGYPDFNSALFLAGSNHVRDSVLWGSKNSHGITVGASSNQITNCNIEGHKQHGINVTDFGSSLLVQGCKIYYNSLEASGAYDGIYVQGSAARPCDAITIIGNYIHQGLASFLPSPDVAYRHAITLDTYHTNAVIEGNSLSRIGPSSAVDNTDALVFGLTVGDTFNGRRFTSSGAQPTNVLPGEIVYQKDTGLYIHHSEYRLRDERLLTSGKDIDGGSQTVGTAGLTSVTVSLALNRFDTTYAVLITPSWNTTWWVTNKTLGTGGGADTFIVHFGTSPSIGDVFDWCIIRNTP